MFSEKTKAELARVVPDKECCRFSELSALMRAEATVEIGNAGRSMSFRAEAAAVARKVYNLLRETFHIECSITIVRKNRLLKNIVYIVKTGPGTDIAPIMAALGALAPPQGRGSAAGLGRAKPKLPRACCAASYLRGTFLGCGSIMGPSRGYHLEVVMGDEGNAQYICGLAAQFGIHFHVALRKHKTVCYLKDADDISGFLALMGAHTSVLDLESIRVVRQVRNGVNRLVNCETANVDKVVGASLRQTEAIGFLKARVGFGALPNSLREFARLRLENPDLSLRELGELLSPPVGKSGANHRMRRLFTLAVENGYLGTPEGGVPSEWAEPRHDPGPGSAPEAHDDPGTQAGHPYPGDAVSGTPRIRHPGGLG